MPSEVLNRGLATSIGSIVSRESAKEGSDDRDDLAPVRDVCGSFFEDEESRLGVDPISFPRCQSHHSLLMLSLQINIECKYIDR